MIVFNAGVPRSGTVYVNALVRHLIGGPFVQANPHGPELFPTLEQLVGEDDTHAIPAIVHTHSWDPSTSALVRQHDTIVGFLNYRDPRDACVSMMKMHDLSFEEAASEIVDCYSVFEETGAETGWLLIRYENLVTNPVQVVSRIASELGLERSIEAISSALEASSLDRHRAVMQEVTDGRRPKIRQRKNRYRVLHEDAETLITDRHIQSGAIGRWRTELGPDECRYLERCFAEILSRYSYAPR